MFVFPLVFRIGRRAERCPLLLGTFIEPEPGPERVPRDDAFGPREKSHLSRGGDL
jgi:hypothetical protein